jgi:hypothetical protein
VTPVLIGLLLAIGLALVVIGVVAYPHLREGASLLTPEGERLARQARQKAQSLAGSAADAVANRGRDAEGQAAGGDSAGGSIGGRAPSVPRSGQASGASTGATGSAGAAGAAGATGSAGSTGSTGADVSDVPGSVPKLGSTRLVWASPPPQPRPGVVGPPPGTASVGGRADDATQQSRQPAAQQRLGSEPQAR